MKNLIFTLILIFVGQLGNSQSMDETASVIYMKANVLFDSKRYDEAVRMYNTVVKTDDQFKQAYWMRAKSKYELGAWKGTKKDIIEFIRLNGVTKEVIKLMAKTELRLENLSAAANYSRTALELDAYDEEQFKVAGMIALASKKKNDACEYWEKGAALGDKRSGELLEKYCGYSAQDLPRKERDRPIVNDRPAENIPEVHRERPNREIVKVEDLNDRKEQIEIPAESGRSEVPESKEEDEEVGLFNEPKTNRTQSQNKPELVKVDVDAYQELEIDDELTIVIGNGLGKRKIDKEPNIFLLADKSGRVVINVCVDREGKVASSELDKDRSTLLKPGLISLALRKTQEFEFFPSVREEQCGYFIYQVTKVEE